MVVSTRSFSHRSNFPRICTLFSRTIASRIPVPVERNVTLLLKDKDRLEIFLSSVWNKPIHVANTTPFVEIPLPCTHRIIHPRQSDPTDTYKSIPHPKIIYDGYATLMNTEKTEENKEEKEKGNTEIVQQSSSSAKVTRIVINMDRGLRDPRRLPSPTYVPALARVHGVTETYREFLSRLPSQRLPLPITESPCDHLYEDINPIHVVTICDFVPVVIDPKVFIRTALKSGYSQEEIDYLINAFTRNGKLWYPVESLEYNSALRTYTVRIPSPFLSLFDKKDPSFSLLNKSTLVLEPLGIPNAVEIIQPQFTGYSNSTTTDDTLLATPSIYGDYLSTNMRWTFVYLPVIKVSSNISESLRRWSMYFDIDKEEIKDTGTTTVTTDDTSPSSSSPSVPKKPTKTTVKSSKPPPMTKNDKIRNELSKDPLFGRLLTAMAHLPITHKGWSADYAELEELADTYLSQRDALQKQLNEVQEELKSLKNRTQGKR